MNYGLNMTLRSILEDPECTAAFNNIFPGLVEQICGRQEALALSVSQVADYTGMLSRRGLDELDKILNEIGKKNGGISPAEHKRIEKYKAMKEADDAKAPGSAVHHQDAVFPGRPWLDVNGNRIQAHAGGFIYENDTYYWYGENKEHTDGQGEIWTWGIRLYASRDFYNWEDCGLIIPPVLDDPNSELFPEKRIDRPHIIKNPATGKYVCWLKNSDSRSCFDVLTADRLTGPWVMVTEQLNPFGMKIGDFDVIISDDGVGYLYCEAEHKTLKGFRLNHDLTDVVAEVSTQYDNILPPLTREGVTVFSRQDKLWMLTSGMTGYVPNQSDSAVSDGFEMPFTPVGNPHVDDDSLSSFNSQIGQVFKVPGKKDLYLAVADRWVPEYVVDRERALQLRRAVASRYYEDVTASQEDHDVLAASPNLSTAKTRIADYVILPIEFSTGRPLIHWKDEWRLEDYE